MITINSSQVVETNPRSLRLSPGVHSVTFIPRSGEEFQSKTVEFEVEAGTAYLVGWRTQNGTWEPVVYDVSPE